MLIQKFLSLVSEEVGIEDEDLKVTLCFFVGLSFTQMLPPSQGLRPWSAVLMYVFSFPWCWIPSVC